MTIKIEFKFVAALALVGCSGGSFAGSSLTAADSGLGGETGDASKPDAVMGSAGGALNSGGTPSGTGGARGSGSSPGTGGATASGGTTSTGGATSIGGTPGTGGSSAGGTPGTGGSSSSCSSGAARCSGTIPTLRETCVAGAWVADSFLCSGGTPVCLNGACVACDPGAKSCASATQPRTCDASGAWAPDTACPAATPLCSDGACSAVCCKLPIGSAINPVSCSSGNAWTCVVPWQGGGGSTYSCTEQGRCAPGLSCGYTSGPYAGVIGTVAACP